MLVTTPIWVGILMKVPSDSSASTIIHGPSPRRALEPHSLMMPPVMTVGSSPPAVEGVGDERGGGGLAVRAGDGDGCIEPHQLGQHLGAADDGQALGARRLQLGVAGLHRAGDDDIARADQVDRIVADEHADALGAQALDVGAVLLVAALHGVAPGVQDLGDRAHADAADAEDVHGAHVGGHLHLVCFPRWRRAAVLVGVDVTRFAAFGLPAPRPDLRDGLPRRGGPATWRRRRPRPGCPGDVSRLGKRLGEKIRREVLLLQAPGRAGIGQPECVLQLVVVDAHAAAAPGSTGGPSRSAPPPWRRRRGRSPGAPWPSPRAGWGRTAARCARMPAAA